MEFRPNQIKQFVTVNEDGSCDLTIPINDRWLSVDVLSITLHVGNPICEDCPNGDLLVHWDTSRHSDIELQALVDSFYWIGGHSGRIKSVLVNHGFSEAAAKSVLNGADSWKDQPKGILPYDAKRIAEEVNMALYGDILKF